MNFENPQLEKFERPLGAHVSIAGGVSNAVARELAVNGNALQIFSRNQRRWESPPLKNAEAAAFREAMHESAIAFSCVHAGYLINLASPKAELQRRSINAFLDELNRTADLGVNVYVVHPGSGGKGNREEAIQTLAANLRYILDATETTSPSIALENTAGQGGMLGKNFYELQAVMHACGNPERLGCCLDTCHAFAAGYDLRDASAWANTKTEIEASIGLDKLWFLHLNDALGECGSHRDRHTHIGRGKLGQAGFSQILHDEAFKDKPGIIETPKEDDAATWDKHNLATLRHLEEDND